MCDTLTVTASLKENETQRQRNINICNYVSFSNDTITITPNELERTYFEMKVLTPENASYGDIYNFNVIALEETSDSTAKYSKLSVQARVPLYGALFKWSYIPFQSKDLVKEEKRAYPVALFGLLFAFLIFLGIFIALVKKLPKYKCSLCGGETIIKYDNMKKHVYKTISGAHKIGSGIFLRIYCEKCNYSFTSDKTDELSIEHFKIKNY